MPLATGARVLEYSTVSYPSGLALGGAIDYIERLGIERARDHAHALDARLIAGLDDLGATIVSPRDAARRNGSVLARFDGQDDTVLAHALADAGVHTSRRLGRDPVLAPRRQRLDRCRPRARRRRARHPRLSVTRQLAHRPAAASIARAPR